MVWKKVMNVKQYLEGKNASERAAFVEGVAVGRMSMRPADAEVVDQNGPVEDVAI